MMGDWRVLETGDELTEKIQELKRKCSKRVLSNYLLSEQQVNEEIADTEYFYTEKGENITLIKRWDDFYQMYYFIGNQNAFFLNLPMSVDQGILICELIEKDTRKRQEEVVGKLHFFGFKDYKRYYLWEYTNVETIDIEDKRLTFTDECEYSVLAEIYKIFDHYSDRLPLSSNFKKFCDKIGKLLCWDGDEYVGAVIYSMNKNVATEEYVYITESAQGKGYAKLLENRFVNHCMHVLHLKRIYAWIEINNVKSIVLHQSAGYLKTDQYKLTLKRENLGEKERLKCI